MDNDSLEVVICNEEYLEKKYEAETVIEKRF